MSKTYINGQLLVDEIDLHTAIEKYEVEDLIKEMKSFIERNAKYEIRIEDGYDYDGFNELTMIALEKTND